MKPAVSHDDFETRYWLRTAAAGSWVTLMMSAAGLGYLLFFAAPQHRLGLALMTGAIAVSGLVTLLAMPWRRIVASPWRESAFLVWGVLSVASIFGMAMVDGGESPLQLALFLPIVFASISFPIRNLVVLAVWAEVAFIALALEGGFDGGYVLVFCATLAGTATMALWQAIIHNDWRRELARSSTT